MQLQLIGSPEKTMELAFLNVNGRCCPLNALWLRCSSLLASIVSVFELRAGSVVDVESSCVSCSGLD